MVRHPSERPAGGLCAVSVQPTPTDGGVTPTIRQPVATGGEVAAVRQRGSHPPTEAHTGSHPPVDTQNGSQAPAEWHHGSQPPTGTQMGWQGPRSTAAAEATEAKGEDGREGEGDGGQERDADADHRAEPRLRAR
jgi:hypothetical protein